MSEISDLKRKIRWRGREGDGGMSKEALEKSIKHWQENVAAKTQNDVRLGPQNCALCARYRDDGCEECPVFHVSGHYGCGETPYIGASSALHAWKMGGGTRAKWRKAAQAELDFLISLRGQYDDG